MRSLITLKALTYAPTGGIVAAPTTSLPEHIGGVRNWDYRYCWLRDATFTLYALLVGGYTDEAQRLARVAAARGRRQRRRQLQIMYGLAGERRLTELELPWLPGYEGSIAGAHRQRGAQAASARRLRRSAWTRCTWPAGSGLPSERECLARAARAARVSRERLAEAGRRHLGGARAAPALHPLEGDGLGGLDRAVKSVERVRPRGSASTSGGAPRSRSTTRSAARVSIRTVNSFVQYYGSTEPDASLLMLPLVGFSAARPIRGCAAPWTTSSADSCATASSTATRLRRTSTALPPGEGAFLLCTFWLADNLALQGRDEEAGAIFERLLALRNDVGLLSEQYDPDARRLVGNFPQAFSHVGLINTARNLTERGGPAEDRHTPHRSRETAES